MYRLAATSESESACCEILVRVFLTDECRNVDENPVRPASFDFLLPSLADERESKPVLTNSCVFSLSSIFRQLDQLVSLGLGGVELFWNVAEKPDDEIPCLPREEIEAADQKARGECFESARWV